MEVCLYPLKGYSFTCTYIKAQMTAEYDKLCFSLFRALNRLPCSLSEMFYMNQDLQIVYMIIYTTNLEKSVYLFLKGIVCKDVCRMANSARLFFF